ncbi:hypothetical protein FQN60_000013, partial [Etheostoma spectabile]
TWRNAVAVIYTQFSASGLQRCGSAHPLNLLLWSPPYSNVSGYSPDLVSQIWIPSSAQREPVALVGAGKPKLNEEMSKIVSKVLDNYPGNNSTTEQAWDFIQRNMECCGWTGRVDWTGNPVIVNSSQLLFPCSCQNVSLVSGNFSDSGFCEAQTPDWPVYDVGCASSVESWLVTNIGLLGMILSICMCRNIHTEDYTKVPKY